MNKNSKSVYIAFGAVLCMGLAWLMVGLYPGDPSVSRSEVRSHLDELSPTRTKIDRERPEMDGNSHEKRERDRRNDRHEESKLYVNGDVASDVEIHFESDLTIVIAPSGKNSRKLLSKQDLFFYGKFAPETCGEFIGVEMVGGDGKYLTIDDPAYQGVFYNRNRSMITMAPVGTDQGVEMTEVPEINISLIDLISRLKGALTSREAMAVIEADGLRFRVHLRLPSGGEWTPITSGWISIDKTGRDNLVQYLESEQE